MYLMSLLHKNLNIVSNKMREQLTKFVEISLNNEGFVVKEELDLCGRDNLVVAGTNGNEKLVLLEPHTTGTKRPRNQVEISKRLKYLAQIVEETNIEANSVSSPP
jgi:hypothetical protein